MLEGKRVARIGIPLLLCVSFFGVQSWLLADDKNHTEPKVLTAESTEGRPRFTISTTSKGTVLPQVLYVKAWKLIKDTYYDPDHLKHDNFNRWEHHYDGKLKTSDDAHKAIETMLASLGDPYTRFLDKDAFDDEKSQIEAHLFGVGMQLGMDKEHKVVVITPLEGTPAFKAGILSGDTITEVDNKPVKGQSLDTVVKQIRGPINTKVEISVARKQEHKKMVLTRAEIPIKAVADCEMLPGNIGYIRLDSFISSKANQEMRDSLKKLSSADGLILDLRNNPGGLLANAIDIASMFLDKGVIVSTIDAEKYKQSTLATPNSQITHQPTVLLINGGSASASEILSGALRDNGRAKLVGEKSFGKGLVQAINRLEDASGINVTIAKYLTPNDTDIHKVGIVPDYKVVVKDDDLLKNGKGPWWIDYNFTNFKHSPKDGKDIQLNKAVEVVKSMAVADKKDDSPTASAVDAAANKEMKDAKN